MGLSGVELVAQDYFGFVCHKMLGTQAILGAELDANAENSVQGLGVTCHRICHRLPDKRRACGGELRRKNGPHILHSTSEWAALLRDSLIIGLSWLPWISECHRGSDMSWPYAFIRMLAA